MVLKRVSWSSMTRKNILTSLKGVLEDEKFVVETAKNGAAGPAAPEALSPRRHFARYLDARRGRDHGSQKRSKSSILNQVVIMMSGHGTVETAVKAIKLGAFDFLEKPLHFDKVAACLATRF